MPSFLKTINKALCANNNIFLNISTYYAQLFQEDQFLYEVISNNIFDLKIKRQDNFNQVAEIAYIYFYLHIFNHKKNSAFSA